MTSSTSVDGVERQGGLSHVALDLGAQGAADGRQRDGDRGAAARRRRDVADHAQFDDGSAQLGVEHLGQAFAELFVGGHGVTLPVE